MKIEITSELLSDIKAKARAATPGPWTASGMESKAGNWNQNIWAGNKVVCEISNKLFCTAKENAAYIAAVSPDVLLALIARIEWLEKKLTRKTVEEQCRQLR